MADLSMELPIAMVTAALHGDADLMVVPLNEAIAADIEPAAIAVSLATLAASLITDQAKYVGRDPLDYWREVLMMAEEASP